MKHTPGEAGRLVKAQRDQCKRGRMGYPTVLLLMLMSFVIVHVVTLSALPSQSRQSKQARGLTSSRFRLAQEQHRISTVWYRLSQARRLPVKFALSPLQLYLTSSLTRTLAVYT